MKPGSKWRKYGIPFFIEWLRLLELKFFVAFPQLSIRTNSSTKTKSSEYIYPGKIAIQKLAKTNESFRFPKAKTEDINKIENYWTRCNTY